MAVNTLLKCFLGGLLLSGCGGSSETLPPPSVTMSAPPPDVRAPGGSAEPAAKKKKAATEVAAPKAPTIPEGAMMVGGGQPNFVLISLANAPPERQFRVQEPSSGLNSTFVTVEAPVTESSLRKAVSLPEGYTAEEGSGVSEAGLPLRIHCEADGAVMALVPEGPFLQGVNNQNLEAGPQHVIELQTYYIDVHEVTIDQFRRFRDGQKEDKQRLAPLPANASASGDSPALGVSWRSAMLYAKWAGKQLPTEAEWEKAARGNQGFLYPWGNGRPIWESSRIIGQITPVGSFRLDESPFGVRDTAGNAREWCQDWYADDAYQQFASTAGVSVKDWSGPRNGDKNSRRVVKGGADRWDVWSRAGISMNESPPDVGFRCVVHLNAKAGEKKSETPSRREPQADSPKVESPQAPSAGQNRSSNPGF